MRSTSTAGLPGGSVYLPNSTDSLESASKGSLPYTSTYSSTPSACGARGRGKVGGQHILTRSCGRSAPGACRGAAWGRGAVRESRPACRPRPLHPTCPAIRPEPAHQHAPSHFGANALPAHSMIGSHSSGAHTHKHVNASASAERQPSTAKLFACLRAHMGTCVHIYLHAGA